MAELVKAVILARGLGTRLRAESGASLDASQRAIAERGVKALMPVGRPLLDYALSRLADAGITEVCLVIGPEHSVIREHVAALRPRRLAIAFAVQREARGTADAVLAAESFADGAPFLALNGDNLYPVDALRRARGLPGSGLVAFAARAMIADGNMRAERLGRFPLVRFNDRHALTALVERDRTPGPGNGADEYISMNCWTFTPAIFDACRTTTPSPRGELEITEAARVAMNAGEEFQVIPMHAPVLDLTDRADVPALVRRLEREAVRL